VGTPQGSWFYKDLFYDKVSLGSVSHSVCMYNFRSEGFALQDEAEYETTVSVYPLRVGTARRVYPPRERRVYHPCGGIAFKALKFHIEVQLVKNIYRNQNPR
jgi:hypothetical protein